MRGHENLVKNLLQVSPSLAILKEVEFEDGLLDPNILVRINTNLPPSN